MFVRASRFLIKQLGMYPLLYYAVEEALECAKIRYYGVGIIAFSQLLNLFNEKTPEDRHSVAHEFLTQRPTILMLESVVERFKNAATGRSKKEHDKVASGDLQEYRERVVADCAELMKKLQSSIE